MERGQHPCWKPLARGLFVTAACPAVVRGLTNVPSLLPHVPALPLGLAQPPCRARFLLTLLPPPARRRYLLSPCCVLTIVHSVGDMSLHKPDVFSALMELPAACSVCVCGEHLLLQGPVGLRPGG